MPGIGGRSGGCLFGVSATVLEINHFMSRDRFSFVAGRLGFQSGIAILSVHAAAAVALTGPAGAAEPVRELEKLIVEGKREQGVVPKESGASTKLDTPLVETPQSVSVVTREEIEARGSRSVQEAVSYAPGVLVGVGGEDSRVDDVTIRGFDAGGFSGNVYLDGLRVPAGGQWTRSQFDVFGLESVEILKGPSSVLYGQVSPGGLVNMVSKRPSAEARHSIGTGYGSFDTWQVQGDSTGPLDSNGDFLYRIAGSYRDGGSQIDHTDLQRFFLAPSITWNISEDTSLTILANIQEDRGGATYQFLPVTGSLYKTPLGRIDRDGFIGEPDFNTFNRDQYSIGYELKHRFNEVFSIEQNLRYSDIETLYESVVAGRVPPDADGNLARRAVRGIGDAHSLTVDTRVKAEFDTGPVEHVALAGVDYIRASWNHDRSGSIEVGPINIFDPVYSGVGGNFLPQVGQDVVEHQLGLYLQEQMAWKNWRLTVGGRYDDSDSSLFDTIAGTTTKVNNYQSTGRAGLLYLFDSGIAPYASYATSFEPVAGTDSTGAAFDPSEGKQVEVGVKYEPKNFNALFTLSAFELTQENVLTLDPNDPLFQTQTGEIEVQGVELEAKVGLTEGLSVIGGWTVLDSEITRNNDGNVGNSLGSAPRQTGSLWLDYTFGDGPLEGLGFGSGVRYVSSRFGDSANTYRLPSYTVLDAGIRYDCGKLSPSLEGMQVSLTGTNLADRDYVAKAETVSSANYGPGRALFLNLVYTW